MSGVHFGQDHIFTDRTGTSQITLRPGIGESMVIDGSVTNSFFASSAWNSVASAPFHVYNTSASTNVSTGALIVSGGIGVNGDIYAGTVYANLSGTATNAVSSTNAIYSTYTTIATSATMSYSYQPFTVINTQDSVSAATGSLIINGGLGISKNLFTNGTVNIQNNTASTSTATGSLLVSGGVGVQGKVYAQEFVGLVTGTSSLADKVLVENNAVNSNQSLSFTTSSSGYNVVNSVSGLAVNPFTKVITATLSGAATSASNAVLTNDVANATDYLIFSTGPTGANALKTNTSMTLNPSTTTINANCLTATNALNSSNSVLVAETSTATNYITFSNGATDANVLKTNANFQVNCSTNVLTATGLTATSGSIGSLVIKQLYGQPPSTSQSFNSTGAGTYNLNYVFVLSGFYSVTAGATYTNNSITYTVNRSILIGATLVASGAGPPLSSGTLAKTGGSGDSSILFSHVWTPNYIKIQMVYGRVRMKF